ncbi:hypothetical protein MTO96_007333 [Rhipicephalus appendiculatus]
MADADVICISNITTTLESYNQLDMYAYSTYQGSKRQLFLTYETVQSLQDKMNAYQDSTNGWALFETQRDKWKLCKKDNYLRLAAIQQRVRLLGKR